MSTSSVPYPTILVVEQEPALADLYASWLDSDYTVLVATSGQKAREKFNPSVVDIIMVNHQMPAFSGEQALEQIRTTDEICQIVLLTDTDPVFDIIDKGFDGYLTQPVHQAALLGIVNQLLTRREFTNDLEMYYRLAAKQTALATCRQPESLVTNERFTEIVKRTTELEAKLDQMVAGFEDIDFEAAFRDFNR